MSTMLSSRRKKASPIQPEGFDGSVVNPSRLVSLAPVSNPSITFTLDANCMSMLMEDVRNFLQQSPEQASPLDTTQRFQSADNSGYQASPTIQKPPLIGSSSMIQTSPLLGGTSWFPIKPKAILQATLHT